MSFTEIEEEQLINLVSGYPALYDASHEKYLNTRSKDSIWSIIGGKMDKNDGDCKKQWKLIRDSYSRYKKKNKIWTGSAAQKKSKHKRHAQLAFLDNVPHHKSSGTSVSPSSENKTGTSSPSKTPEDSKPKEEDCVKTEDQSTLDDDDAMVIVEEHCTQTVTSNGIKPPHKDKRTKRNDKMRRQRNRQSLRKSIVRKKEDDIDLFARHIAEVLRNLPPIDKAKAKKHLSDVLFVYEISAASRSSHSDNSYLSNSSSLSNY